MAGHPTGAVTGMRNGWVGAPAIAARMAFRQGWRSAGHALLALAFAIPATFCGWMLLQLSAG